MRRLIALIVATVIASTVSAHSALAQSETVLYSFANAATGEFPSSPLFMDSSGALYGTTGSDVGQRGAGGTLFKLTPPSSGESAWTETVLRQFGPLDLGRNPAGALVARSGGGFYGAAAVGGTGQCLAARASGCGVVYEATPPVGLQLHWQQKVLYDFKGGPHEGNSDGSEPSGLIADNSGALYGVTYEGGTGTGSSVCTNPTNGFDGCGIVFKLTPPAVAHGTWTETVLYNFCSRTKCADGANPVGTLHLDRRTGALYGETRFGGNENSACSAITNGNLGCGVVFKLTPPALAGGNWNESVVYAFCSAANCSDGASPLGGLTANGTGGVYGAASLGGANGGGAIFDLGLASKKETLLYNFCDPAQLGADEICTDGATPNGDLVVGAGGVLYGTSTGGGAIPGVNEGTIFALTPPVTPGGPWSEAVLHSFAGAANGDGYYPESGLIEDNSGALYGTTIWGGAPACATPVGCGTVFKLNP